MHRRSIAPLLFVVLWACGGSGAGNAGTPPNTTTSGPSGSSGGAPPSDVCAGDSWLPQVLGERPSITNTMWLEPMKRTRTLGPQFTKTGRIQMDYLYELDEVKSSSVEMYIWDSKQPNTTDAKLAVVRNAFGDPRQLRQDNTLLYGAPVPLANGVLEYPPSPEAATRDISFRPRGGRALYTFPDGTWVRVDAWMMQRVRGAFASGPPPRPTAGPDVAWEICGTIDAVLRSDHSGTWGIRPERGTLRFLAGREPADAEMVFRFQSDALAMRAEGEQRVRCGQPSAPRQDKGLFSLVPPCNGILSGGTAGPLLHYTFKISQSAF